MKKAFGFIAGALAAVPMAVSEESAVSNGKQKSAFSSKLEIVVSMRNAIASRDLIESLIFYPSSSILSLRRAQKI